MARISPATKAARRWVVACSAALRRGAVLLARRRRAQFVAVLLAGALVGGGLVFAVGGMAGGLGEQDRGGIHRVVDGVQHRQNAAGQQGRDGGTRDSGRQDNDD